MEAGDFETSDVESVLSYRVDTDADYGRLVCRSESQTRRRLYFILIFSQGRERSGGGGRALYLHCDALSQVSFR